MEYDGSLCKAQVVALSDSKRRQNNPVKVHYIGLGEEYDQWVGMSRIRSKALKVDYSGLEVGTTCQVLHEGVSYNAEVLAVSDSARRSKAPVKIRYHGYGEEDDEWVGADRLRSKALRSLPQNAQAGGEFPTTCQVDYSGLKVGATCQVLHEGVSYNAEVVAVSDSATRAKAPVKVRFSGYGEEGYEWVGADRLRSKALRRPFQNAQVSDAAAVAKGAGRAGRAVGGAGKFSMADQVARFERAKKDNNARFLDISSVYDGSKFKGKRVLVIGANKGLGLELTKELHSVGADCVTTCRTSNSDLDAASGQVISDVEVTSATSMTDMAGKVEGPLDLVIYNAGYFPDVADSLDTPQFEEAIKQIDICGVGPLRCVAALKAAGHISAERKPKVVIISSQAGSARWRSTQNKDKGCDYGHHMSRAACNMGGVLMAEELRKLDVPVVMLHPGFNRTTMTSKYSAIWDREGAVEPAVGAKRVLHECSLVTMDSTGTFINCEDGLLIPW